ncbi:ISL3 family transposase, partial [Deinococcus saxicola]|uniref:ISL3 family transposase n=1 Tax=Deinococcus saxicola TaxID=249406 RepID=UPI003D0A9568
MAPRVHSRYQRVLKDLACFGRRVRLHLRVRRFFCDSSSCPQRIFCERLILAAPRQRLTRRLAEQVTCITLEAGAECSARCLALIGQPVSPDTLLRTVPELPDAPSGPVRHLGIDDWAWRKGQRYGTILVDLDRHQAIDLLPDREVETLVSWLQAHPELEIITRDRSGAYQEAATLGAPQALQVADRWHLLKNLRETLERFLQRLHQPIQEVFRKTAGLAAVPQNKGPAAEPSPLCFPTPRAQQRFQAIHDLKALGHSPGQITQHTGLSKVTVRKYLRLKTSPGQPHRRQRTRLIDPYREWLKAQWDAGTRNATHLFGGVKQRGYTGGFTVIREWCRLLRCGESTGEAVAASPVLRCPAARTLSWMMLCPEKLTQPIVQLFLKACRQDIPWFTRLETLALTGWQVLRGHSTTPLRVWLHDLTESGFPEFVRFAVGLDRDFDAVQAAVETSWSNGQVEGQVNRLKTLKRSMYGRAGLNLLRARLL